MDGALMNCWLFLFSCPVPRWGLSVALRGILRFTACSPWEMHPHWVQAAPQHHPQGDSCSSQLQSCCCPQQGSAGRQISLVLCCSPSPAAKDLPPPPGPKEHRAAGTQLQS